MLKLTVFLTVLFLFYSASFAQPTLTGRKWTPFFLQEGDVFSIDAPSSNERREIKDLLAIQNKIDNNRLSEILRWSAGAPDFHWQKLMSGHWMKDTSYRGMIASVVLSVAMHDAMVIAFRQKAKYKRQRPYELDKRIKVFVPRPESSSYPCEYAVAAGVAVSIFSEFFPAMKDSTEKIAQKIMGARVASGVVFPGDMKASFELGKQIAVKEINHVSDFPAKQKWDGVVPKGPQFWRGRRPMFPMAGQNKTIVLDSSNQFRPAPPPDFTAEMEELKKEKPNFLTVSNAFYWANVEYWSEELTRKIFEYNYHLKPLESTWMAAVATIATYDGFVACWDAKYTYWGIRPGQLDTTYRPPLLVTPPFPGYPSGHAVVSGVMCEVLSLFFPQHKRTYERKAKEGAKSRFDAGIHFRSDNEVGLEMGKKIGTYVGKKLIFVP